MATSQSDPTITDADSFFVMAYNPMLAAIQVSPDSVVLNPEQTQRFTALATDSFGQEMEITVSCSATGGTIDSSGFYTAGSDTGYFEVNVEDSINHVAASAVVHITTSTDVAMRDNQPIPTEFALEQNYPNPFNPMTTIEFSVKEKCHVELKVYDIRGREVATLVDGHHPAGFYKASFNTRHLASGVYFYRIRMLDFVAVRKMVVLE